MNEEKKDNFWGEYTFPDPKFAEGVVRALKSANERSGKESALVTVMTGITNGLKNCDVYFKLADYSRGSFKLEVLCVVNVDGKLFTTAMRTPHISDGSTAKSLERHVFDVVNGLAKMAGVRIFNGKAQSIPSEAWAAFEEPA